ncbi:MAG: hypothetical protein ACYDBJ_07730 [Aggregatilineales bacterium]
MNLIPLTKSFSAAAAGNASGAKACLISSDAGHGDYFYGVGGDGRSRDGCRVAAARKVA